MGIIPAIALALESEGASAAGRGSPAGPLRLHPFQGGGAREHDATGARVDPQSIALAASPLPGSVSCRLRGAGTHVRPGTEGAGPRGWGRGDIAPPPPTPGAPQSVFFARAADAPRAPPGRGSAGSGPSSRPSGSPRSAARPGDSHSGRAPPPWRAAAERAPALGWQARV